jgi:hypothetical protein
MFLNLPRFGRLFASEQQAVQPVPSDEVDAPILSQDTHVLGALCPDLAHEFDRSLGAPIG